MKNQLLILSGPTHEYIDPVRFIGNASSGKMGKALAEEAVKQGFNVTFVSGPVPDANLPALPAGKIIRVISAAEMLAQASQHFFEADCIIFAAAIADYAPAERQMEKIAKSEETLTLQLRPTPDIAKTLGALKQPGQITIGFALQTSAGEQNARRKLVAKNLDAIVLNTPATLGAETGTFSFITAETLTDWGCIDKTACAKNIIENALYFIENSKENNA